MHMHVVNLMSLFVYEQRTTTEELKEIPSKIDDTNDISLKCIMLDDYIRWFLIVCYFVRTRMIVNGESIRALD